jgi:hypothetical protein
LNPDPAASILSVSGGLEPGRQQEYGSSTMTKFITGAIIGAIIATTAPAIAQSSGLLSGWDVRKGGRLICRDPFMRPALREISCE